MFRQAFPLASIVLAAAFGLVEAQPVTELEHAMQLQRSGDPSGALRTADRFLADHPKDAQMRFLRAALLAETQRVGDAIEVLERLTEDYPDLAEPYNNLAVLRASNGDYAKAREALEQALRLKPAYATARENLGDVYMALAALAYADSLRIEPGRAGLDAKLAALRKATTAASAPLATARP